VATGWTVRGSKPGRGEIFPHPFRPTSGAHPASYKMGNGSFPGRGVDHPPSSSAEVMERVQLYVCSTSGPS